MQHPQIPSRYAHLATGPWELHFLSNPDYLTWLDTFTSIQPIHAQERLVDYVRQRLPSITPSLYRANPTPTPTSFASSSASPPSSTFATSSSLPPANPSSFNPNHRNIMNGSIDVDISDYIDYSLIGDDQDSSASYAAALDNSFASTSSQPGGANGSSSNSLLSNVNPNYSTYSAAPSTSSSSTISPYPPPPSSTYPPTSSGLVYSTNPYGVNPAPQSKYFSTTASVDPSSFFASPQPSNPSTSSTLAMQSQLIQDERNRRLAASTPPAAIHPSSLVNNSSAPAVSQPLPVTATISPSMMTTTSQPTKPSARPVASSSRTTSPVVEIPVPSKKSSKVRSTSATPSSSGPSESIKRWNKVLPDIRTNLSTSRLQKAPTSAAQRLLALLTQFNHTGGPTSTLSDWSDGSDVPPEGRKEVLTDLLKYAREEFWKAWVDEAQNGKSLGIELLSFWFEGASKGFDTKKDKEKMKEKENGAENEAEKKRRGVEQMTLALVLQAFCKLPISHRQLLNMGSVAPRVKKISSKGEDGAVKAAATLLFGKWKKVQDEYNSSQNATSSSSSSTKDKKPNGSSSSTSKDKTTDSAKRKSVGPEDGPSKKSKITTTTSTTMTTKKPPTSFPPVATTKLTANLNFKKKPEATNPPSTMNAMRAALAQVKKPDPPPPPPPAPAPSTGTAGTTTTRDEVNKNGKRKKSVRWAPDDMLEAIKYIEKAIYGDEAEGQTGLGLGEGEEAEENFREMEQQEGLSLSMHLDEDDDMEEEIDWYEPIEVAIPENDDFASLRQEPDSAEAKIQTERESNLMAVDPESLSTTDSPAEPPEYAPAEPDPESRPIPLPSDLASDPKIIAEIAAAQAAAVPLGGFAANDQIESLLGQLNTSIVPQAVQPSPALTPGGIDPATLEALKGYDLNQIRQILDTQPAFRGMTVENLGLTSQGGGGGSAYSSVPQGSYDHQPPTHYGSAWSQPNYGQPWQPSNPAPSHVDAYNGYLPPAAAAPYGGHGAMPLPSQKAALKKGKKRNKTAPCKFFKTSRGCDWGDKCSFSHDNS
ncbi:uncharacterized protein JCM6883_007651 [Sporobolomyces salmoneus]|uniref:uncharacterized protein n=1 Tax=Sporobolomyces salmoneus TaxID=183962 RepID=UPI00317EBFE6